MTTPWHYLTGATVVEITGLRQRLPITTRTTFFAAPTTRQLRARHLKRLLGLVAVAPVSAEECDRSLRSNEPDFEDGLVRACAELNGADFIITRDEDAFAGSKVKSATAKEFLFTVDHEDRELLAALLGCGTI